MFTNFNFQQILSAFIVLFAVIDIIGAIPIIIDLKDKGKDVNALKATLISFLLLLGFFYAGDIQGIEIAFYRRRNCDELFQIVSPNFY